MTVYCYKSSRNVTLRYGLRVAVTSAEKDLKIILRDEAMNVVVRPLQ